MVGQTVSHYRVVAKLGEGGMGAVYRAEDLTLERAVALKFLPATLTADRNARERLKNEARAASRLNHPNIATIYEVGETEETPFIAMELVTGESLKQMLSRGALPAMRLMEVARQIADGLGEAHAAGVLHRDIKPGNVMLDARGRAKILDFGLAVLASPERGRGEDEETFVSRTATLWSTAGTIPYMSPEQLRGEAADARSDIFSFGVLLYECLTGRLPFPGETSIDILHGILRSQPIPLRNLLPEISSDWEQVIERCLAKSPEQRYRSIQEVVDALKRLAAPITVAEKSVAVLYFENLAGSKEDEYFRDGMTEDVITELSKIKGLRVFPRSAVLAFRDKQMPTQQIGRQLDAAHVLEGSIRRAGNRLRVTTQLVETRTGHSVWAERYDRQLEDVFAIQDEIAQSIARALRVMLTEKEKREIEKKPTADVQAYDFYLRGRQFFHQFRRKGIEFAREMFTRAIEIDPGYARAYAGLADCCSFVQFYWDPSEANLRQADEASRKALELDPESAEAHAARGHAISLTGNYEEAKREFQAAIRLDPQLYEAYYFHGRSCFIHGELDEARRMFEQACRVRPDAYQAACLLANTLDGLGNKVEADAAHRRALQVVGKHLELHPDDVRALYLGAQSLCRLGNRDLGLKWAKRALAIDPDDSAVCYNVAAIHAILGEAEQALDYLDRAIEAGFRDFEVIKNDPYLNSIRETPRYQAALGRVAARRAVSGHPD
jgi:non-specific serine/threonine protein kinase